MSFFLMGHIPRGIKLFEMELKKYLDICINSYYIIEAFCHKLFFQETSFVNSFSREILGFLVTLFRFPVFFYAI